jgi:DnaJ-class molecular chaperone
MGSAIAGGIKIMAKNYYSILGVLPDATPEDIRGAYKRRAKELHPDHYGENSHPFLEVQEAYNVLSDPLHRRSYDHSRQKSSIGADSINSLEIEPLRPRSYRAEPLRGTGQPANLGEIYPQHSFQTVRPSIEEIFDRLWSNFDSRQSFKSERLKELCLEIILTPDEARRGGQMEIMLPSRTVCPTCGGQGNVEPYQCLRCEGSGDLYQEVPVVIEFGPGIRDGYQRAISLRRLGIHDVYITLLFRISGTAD